MKSKKIFWGITLALVLTIIVSIVALADNIGADADALVLNTPHSNNVTATQASGTTVSYDFSAVINNTGNSSNDVFKNSGDSVSVSITKGGDWLNGGTSGPWSFTAYDAPKAGKITISVPCGSLDITKTMTVVLVASASNGQSLNPDNQNLSYVITGGTDDSSCTPTPPTNTKPVVTVTGVTNGASYEFGSVPVAGCSVTDTEDGPSTFAATLSAITGPLASYGLGGQTASCSYTDAGGLSDSASATYSIEDNTDPTITYVSRSPGANDNGWNNSAVTVTWTCSDDVGVVSGTITQTVNTEGEDQSVTGTCEDVAGNTASDIQSGINIDWTAPTASASASPEPNSNGWNNTDVTVSFNGEDELSGIDFCDTDVVLSDEGAGQSASGTCTDKAGNVSDPATANGINIDKTKPTASASASPEPNINGWNNTDVTVSFSGEDGLSGVDFCDTDVVLSDEGTGQSASGTCTDEAGNVSDPATANGINIDKTKPTASASASPEPNSNGWNNTNVTVSFSGEDGLSGIDFCDTDVVLSDEGAEQSASGTCTDKAGNVSDPATANGINIDKTAPSLNITGAATGYYGVCGGIPTRPSFSPTDNLSLIASSSDTWEPSLTPSGVGNYAYSATATDYAGNTTSETRSYKVTYGAAFNGFFQPINMNGSSIFKITSTIPVKFSLSCNGVQITNAVVKLYVGKLDSSIDPGELEAISTSASTEGNLFRFSDTQYIFNLSTKKGYVNPDGTTASFTPGSWVLYAVLDDGTSRSVVIQLKK
jgi:hypothetical protein